MDDAFKNLWAKQIAYNNQIKAAQNAFDPEFWTEQYLLGITSEMDEVLREINWKKHRKLTAKTVDKVNLGYELADLTKYLLSLWQVWGFTLEDMVQFSREKSAMLEQQCEQEKAEIPLDALIVLLDLDGTTCDWRSTFISWVNQFAVEPLTHDPVSSLLMDTDLSMRYADYFALKEEFEATGGYREMQPYPDTIQTIQELRGLYNAYIIVSTARPAKVYHRIWWDTWSWLKMHRLPVNQLLIGAEPRILLADKLNNGRRVIMFEDDPGLILRAANSGIQVFARRQPYNVDIKHENVTILGKYTDFNFVKYLEKETEHEQ